MPRAPRVRTAPLPAPRWWAFVLAGLTYSACSAASLPPVGVWPLALIAIIPLVWAATRATATPKRSALMVAGGTLPFWAFEQAFLWDIAPPGYPALCVYLSMFIAAFVWVVAHARRADWRVPLTLVVPVAWTMIEVALGQHALGGYAWFVAGHPLIDAPFLAAPGATFGAHGVSFLCAALAGAVADAAGWSGVPRGWGGIGAGVLAVLWTLAGLPSRLHTEPAPGGPTLRIAAVQTNLPQSNKMVWSPEERRKDLAKFTELTRAAAASRPAPDVICWPETMFPGMALNPEAIEALRGGGVHYKSGMSVNQFADELAALQGEIGIPMLVGCAAVDGDILADLGAAGRPEHSRIYNSVVLVDKGRPQATRYDKVELTPFGEVIPIVWRWPRLQNWVVGLGATGMAFELSPGDRAAGIDVPVRRSELGGPTMRVATPICFEVTRAALCRRLLLAGRGTRPAPILINFSNDGWFGWWDGGRDQHVLAARWRCLELGRPMVRCVNTGVSCQIDGRGRVVTAQLLDKPDQNKRVDGVLLASVPIGGAGGTPFEAVGLLPMQVVMGAGMVGTLVLWRRSRRVAAGAI